MRPDLTISIINHSNPRLLQACLRSIFVATHAVHLDIWVVDNATNGAYITEMQAEFPCVRWLFNSEPRGFSANHNQVLSQADGRYLCILNDDTLVHDGAFDTIIAYLDAQPLGGIAGARLLNADGSQQNCAFRFPTLWSELVGICFLPGPLNMLKTIGIHPAQNSDQPTLVDWVLGACIVVRGTALPQIGLLDCALSPIGYNEEVDWCYRAREAGWQVAYCPAAVLTHYGGQSFTPSHSGIDTMRLEWHRTRQAFFRKHYGLLPSFLLWLIYWVTLPWNALMLTQSAVRRTITVRQHRNTLATLYAIAGGRLR